MLKTADFKTCARIQPKRGWCFVRKLFLCVFLCLFPIFSFATTLPSGYTELEYIESTGTQYIDTGLKFATSDTRLDYYVKCSVQNTNVQGEPTFLSNEGGSGGKGFNVDFVGVARLGTFSMTSPYSSSAGWCNSAVPTGAEPLEVTGYFTSSAFYNNYMSDVYEYSSYVPQRNDKNILLFTYSPSERFYTGKMYAAKLTIDNVLKRDFVPAKRNSDGAIGMYDTVNNVFYTNAGTGTFTAGPSVVLPNEYTRLEYISTNHDSYILTDLTVNDFDRVTARTTLYDYGSEENITRGFPNLFGARTGAASYQDGKLFRFYDNNIYNGKNITTFSSLYDDLWSEGWPVYTPTAIPLNTAVDYDIKLANGEQYIKINGGTVASNTLQGGVLNNSYPVVIFGTNYRGVIKNIPHLDCEYMTFYNGNNIVVDFIPAKRNSDNKIGMYDIVSDTFYPLLNTSSGFIIDDNNVDLPCSYTQLEYIESTGTQYIDTGFVYDNNTRVVWDVQMTAQLPLSENNSSGVGYVSSNSERLGFGFESANQKLLLFKAGASGNTRLNTIDVDNNRHVIEVNSPDNKGYVDSVEYTFDSSVGQINNVTHTTLPLLAWYSNITGGLIYQFHANAKLYSTKIWDNGTLAREMIPAKRNSDNAIGLYDIANDVFYINSGTGTFVAGPTVSSNNNCQTINITWDGLSEPEASGMCVYGETFTAPGTAPTAPSGLKFLGWIPR